MRRGLITSLVLASFLLWTATFAAAGTVVWTTLQSANPTGNGPGPDGVIGVPGCPGSGDDDDTTTGEWNTCNFDTSNACMTSGSPSSGSYSFSATEYLYEKTCYGGTNIGRPCTDDGQCPGSNCFTCADNPSGWDMVLYLGNIGNQNGNGTMTVTQEDNVATITSLKTGTTSPDPLAGPLCMNLDPAGAPYTTSACGVDVQFSYSLTTVSKAFNCAVPIGTSSGVTTQARVIDITDATPTPTCGYSAADILCLRAEAPPTATYLLITCADQVMPDPLPILCLSGATVQSRQVYWTADDASDCEGGGGGCMADTALKVE
jgi:hypothetical protein